MRKFACALAAAASLLSACSEKSDSDTAAAPQATAPAYEKFVFSYRAGELKDGCSAESPMVCAMESMAKCTIDPGRADCDRSKMPDFVFMNDESLQRPTEMSFRVYKLKPLNDGSVEAYTESTCNGNWFGLCQGNVIYVLSPNGNDWKVKDVYALAAPAPQAEK